MVPKPMRVHLQHLFTSPGHNYFGRHGREPGMHGIIDHESIQLLAGRGIEGDRFFNWKDGYKGQITFIDASVVEDIRVHAGNPDLPAGAFRRNVVISGIDLNTLIGTEFTLGGVRFKGTEECRPCHWMDKACGREGTEDLMKGRGGLRCRILTDGVLHRGETDLI